MNLHFRGFDLNKNCKEIKKRVEGNERTQRNVKKGRKDLGEGEKKRSVGFNFNAFEARDHPRQEGMRGRRGGRGEEECFKGAEEEEGEGHLRACDCRSTAKEDRYSDSHEKHRTMHDLPE